MGEIYSFEIIFNILREKWILIWQFQFRESVTLGWKYKVLGYWKTLPNQYLKMQCFIESDITQYYPDAVFFNVGSLLDRIGNGSLLSFKSTAVTFFMSALVWTTLKIVLQDQWKFLRVAISKLFCRKIEPADEDAAREELLALVNYWMNLPHGMKLWILNDKDYITAACGETGFEYLTFQRCLICFQLVMATLWCGILIPIHLKMGSNNLPEPLDRISILNMDINSEYNLIWVHIGLGFAIIPGILLMFTVFYQWIDKVKNCT